MGEPLWTACCPVPSVGIFLDAFHDADIHSGRGACRLRALHALGPVLRPVGAATAAGLPGCLLPGPRAIVSAGNLLHQRGDQAEGGGRQRSMQPLIADDCLEKACNGAPKAICTSQVHAG